MKHLKLILSIFVLFTVVALSAFSGVFTKGGNAGLFSFKHHSHKYDGGGPVHFKTLLDNDYYYDNNNIYLLVDVNTDKVYNSSERTPLNIAVVIDRSGSMNEKNKLEYVK